MIGNKTAAFNEILIRLGESRISSWESTDSRAVVLRSLFDQAVSEVLREYPWICATGRAVLARLPVESFTEYQYVFQLPGDCLSVQNLFETSRYREIDSEYIIEGRRLYCDLESVGIKYTKSIEIQDMDSHVAEAVILRVASKVTLAIVPDVRIEGNMLLQYQEALKNAKYTDGLERVNSKKSYEAWVD